MSSWCGTSGESINPLCWTMLLMASLAASAGLSHIAMASMAGFERPSASTFSATSHDVLTRRSDISIGLSPSGGVFGGMFLRL